MTFGIIAINIIVMYYHVLCSMYVLCILPSVRSRVQVTDRSFTHHVLYFGILYPNNCDNLRCLHHSALLLILLLHLPCPRISFTLNSKLFSLNKPFLLSLLHQILSVFWSHDLAQSFFTLSFIFTLFIYASVSE